MKYLLVLVALLPFAFAALSEETLQLEFTNFMQKYNKSYDHDEFQYRFGVFKSNAHFIDSHNSNPNSTYKVAINAFADLTNEEYRKIYLGFRGHEAVANQLSPVVVSTVGLPTSVDWRTQGAVTHVKNQGQCGSCWSFSTTGSTEGSHKIAGNTLVSLSEQQLVDCSTSYGNMGCDGGLMDNAFKYIMNAVGLESESEYPYTASDGTCHFVESEVKAKIDGYHNVPSGSEADLTADIVIAPISVAIDASHSSFQFYSSGVYYEPACSSTQLDHGVLAVGYGVDGSADYYIVKNSWGTDWGMSGYIWMSRNRNNNCGIATMASYPCTTGEANCAAT